MKRFKALGLLLHLDKDNTDAIQSAVDCAKCNDAKLYVICAQKQALANDKQQQITEALAAKINCQYELTFLTGQPVVAISQYVSMQSIDLLIMEPDRQKGLKRFFFGSLTLSLLRKAPCPVWVVKPGKERLYQRILICINPVVEDQAEQRLNSKLIEIGTSLAQRESAECHLVCAWALAGESTLASPFVRTPIEEINQLRIEEKQEVARAFEALQAEHKQHLHGAETHLIYGEPVSAIVDFVDQNSIDLVVMGTVARSGVQGFVIGNTAEAVINQLECSIMAIKPDGFVSPLV